MRVREVAGGGRAVEVPPERLRRWFDGFAERNGGVASVEAGADGVVVRAVDGTTATVTLPFGPAPEPGVSLDELVAAAIRPRRVGLVLVRLGAHSVGVAEGDRVVVSRTDRHLVHGRSAAGGWSQQRFARRRDKQASEALARAARDVAEVLIPQVETLEAVVLGGDRRALDDLRTDRRLAPVFALAVDRVLDVGEPRRSVLDDAAVRARAVEIVIRD